MASHIENRESEDFSSRDEETGRYPVDSQFYGLEPSLGKALVEMSDETEAYAMPDINLSEAKRTEYANKGRIFRFFKKETDLMLNRDGDVIRLRNKAEREGAENLSKSETTLLVNRLKTIMQRAWRATEAEFGKAIPDDWGKKIKNSMGAERNLGVVSAMKTEGGIPETSEIFKPDKGIGLASDQKKIGWIRNSGAGRGPASKIKKVIKLQKKRAEEQDEIPAEDDQEPKEQAA